MDSMPSSGWSITAWLSVPNSSQAVEFYQAAFGATEVYRLEVSGGGVVARLSVHGSEFWVANESPTSGDIGPASLGGGTVRMILTVPEPDEVFTRALAAGGSEIFPMGEGHGWRLGRLVDPFGLHWEIGRPLDV